MADRRVLRPLAGIGTIALVAAALGVLLTWASADLQARLFEFYNQQSLPQQIDEQTYREWDRISTVAYSLQSVAMPMFLISLVAVLAILAVLARNAEARG